jgi:hypothetical protein
MNKANLIRTIRYAAILLFALLLHTSESFAAKLYRCDGRVQFRPCEQGNASAEYSGIGTSQSLQSAKASHDNPQVNYAGKAQITKVQFTKTLRKGSKLPHGLWRGYVSGKGDIQLLLRFLKDNQIFEERKVGNVELYDNTTNFSIVSALPRISNWKWELVAFAR